MEAEKQREVASDFDLQEETFHLGDTEYGMMMRKMELDTSKPPENVEELPKPVKKEVVEKREIANKGYWLLIGAIYLLVFIGCIFVIVMLFMR